MRRCLLAVAVLLLCPAITLAQGMPLGVKGGVNLATQHIDDPSSPNLGSRVGLVAGVFTSFHLISWLEIQPEALYSVKGARVDQGGVTSSLAIDYLEVPVLARVSRGGVKRRYYVAAGPSTAVRLRARVRTKFAGSTEEIDVSDDIQRVDFGITAGGGIEFGRWVADGRYTHGLSDIDKATGDASVTRNRAISVTFGLRF